MLGFGEVEEQELDSLDEGEFRELDGLDQRSVEVDLVEDGVWYIPLAAAASLTAFVALFMVS